MFSWTRRFNPYCRIRGLIAMNKRLNWDCQDLADRLGLNATINANLLVDLVEARQEIAKLKAMLRDFAEAYLNHGEDDPVLTNIAQSNLTCATEKE